MAHPYFRDAVAGDFRKCMGECGGYVLKPARKCSRCKKTKKYKVTVARPRNKGRNAVGTCLHKPEKSRIHTKVVREGGNVPQVREMNWEFK